MYCCCDNIHFSEIRSLPLLSTTRLSYKDFLLNEKDIDKYIHDNNNKSIISTKKRLHVTNKRKQL